MKKDIHLKIIKEDVKEILLRKGYAVRYSLVDKDIFKIRIRGQRRPSIKIEFCDIPWSDTFFVIVENIKDGSQKTLFARVKDDYSISLIEPTQLSLNVN